MTVPFYNPDTPLITTTFADWQISFRDNFDKLNSVFLKNHIALTAASLAGNHKFVELLERKDSPQTSSSEFSIFTNFITGQTDQVMMSLQNNNTFQFTNFKIIELPQTDEQTSYYTFLPGRMIVYFGLISPPVGSQTVELFLNPPVMKYIQSVNLTSSGGTLNQMRISTIRGGSETYTSIQIFSNAGTTLTPLYYTVMGIS